MQTITTIQSIIYSFVSVARENIKSPDFKLGTDYCRNDIRRFLTAEQRKSLSLQVGRANGHRMIKHSAYRDLCRRIGSVLAPNCYAKKQVPKVTAKVKPTRPLHSRNEQFARDLQVKAQSIYR